MSTYIQGTLFEKGYLLRTLGAIAHDPDIALTELVANCWDAGASAVHVTIPDLIGGDLKIQDDGAGMLTDDFLKRWMRLGYDRQEHQGKSAEFPPDRAGWKRLAYGRNGVGRHGLLCFADDYEVIEAIRRLSGDEKADELHTLHPLVAEARWVFGPEFDTPEYASNQTIRNAVQKVFGKNCPPEAFENARKRSDLLIMANASLSAVGLEVLDPEAQLVRTRDVLLIELKRGRSAIGREEMNQADGYVQDIFGSGHFANAVRIYAFVVGHEVAPKTEPNKQVGSYGTLRATTYGTLVDTASKRLFGLKQRLNERYGELQKDAMPSSLRRALSNYQPELAIVAPLPSNPVSAA